MGALLSLMENGSINTQLDAPLITNTATLFDSLPIDALCIIVKQMCRLLLKKKWPVRGMESGDEPTSYMPNASKEVRLLALLFSENSPFQTAAATLFTQIGLGWEFSVVSISSSTGVVRIGPEWFRGEAKEMELGRKIFTACGPYVRKIVVVEGPSEDAEAKQFMELSKWHVFKYCRNVEEVTFWRHEAALTKWGTASSFIREYAANLRTIDWQGKEDEGFLDFRKCTNIRCLKSNCLSTATLVSVLKTCGSTLEELKIAIRPAGDNVEVIETIRKYCKQLNAIRIRNVKAVIDIVGQESYSSLLCSYGSKLKNASVNGLGHEHLAEVVNACSNLEFWMYCPRGESVDWHRVYAMGPRLVSLNFIPSSLIGDKYPRALEQCTNLRRLSMRVDSRDENQGFTDEMIANVFSPASFPKLESLTIRKFRANEQNMRLIASCTANLKDACFKPFKSEPEARVFRFISDSNRHLKKISVSLDVARNSESGLEWLSELVKIFRQCKRLTFLVLCSDQGRVGREDLIRVCKVLPCRDVYVHVRIGHVDYGYSS